MSSLITHHELKIHLTISHKMKGVHLSQSVSPRTGAEPISHSTYSRVKNLLFCVTEGITYKPSHEDVVDEGQFTLGIFP